MAWDSRTLQLSPQEQAIGHLANHAMGNQFSGINQDVVKTFNLYRFFVQHLNTPAATLQPMIMENGIAIFTIHDIEEIQAKIRTQTNTNYVKQLTQVGGATPTTAPSAIPIATPVGVPVGTPVGVAPDPSRNKFWDKFIKRLTYPIWSNIPPSWDGLLWYVFILHSFEQMDVIGPFVSTVLDTITLTLPNIPSLIDSVLPKVIGLLPFPYMSTAGDLISYAVGLIFILLGVFLNIQRRHFGSAFKTSIEIIPVIGDSVAEMAQSVEIGADRYELNRAKILSKITPITPTLGNYLQYYTPNMDIPSGSAPQFSIPAIKQDLVLYAKKETGIDDMMDKIPNPADIASSAISGAINSTVAKATNAVSGATAAASNAATKAVSGATASASNATSNAASNAVPSVTPPPTNTKTEAKTAFAPQKTRKRGGASQRKGTKARRVRISRRK